MTSFTSDHSRHVFEESPCEFRNAVCNLCKNEVSFESNAYFCRECRSNFHKDCLTITYTKIHEHTLTFIRRNISVPCDICGQDNDGINMYTCLKCDFYVHRDCFFLPKAIKITRHPHRLSHTLRIPDGSWRCGICRFGVHVGYGGYTCIKETCDYVVHSYCATESHTWDGKDVEGEREEEIDSEVELGALVEIDGRSTYHFSHDHELMRLDVKEEEEEEEEEESGHVCQACILPIEFGKFLDCKQCKFSLHSACASLPRNIENVLHRHPLTVHVDTMKTENGFFTCFVCNQHSCGFMYRCCQEDCEFKIDVKCASFVEPFNHISHRHPFYMAEYFDKTAYKCYGCNQYSKFAVECGEYCLFRLGFQCVNLQEVVKYKYDTHPLTLYYCDRDSPDTFLEPPEWCEICEEHINNFSFCYICYDCCTSIHVDCILGKYPYLKSGHKIKINGLKVQIVSNYGVSRPRCYTCQRICQDKLVFMGKENDVCFCSIECIHSTK